VEKQAVTSWWSISQEHLGEPERDSSGRLLRRPPPGAGKFLIKASGDQPGIPVDVFLTSVERTWGGQQTSSRWDRDNTQTTEEEHTHGTA
jgi:hypothetical protein